MPEYFIPHDIIRFWFSDAVSKHWFSSAPALDDEIRRRFESLWRDASTGKRSEWKNTPEGCLALVIVLDQFPLNMFRGEAASFETEQMSVAITRHALRGDFHKRLAAQQQAFLYMPLMHSERMEDQERSVKLYEEAGLEDNLAFAKHHREIIRRFGRFPHRNAILGRESTAQELEYLRSEGAFLG
jgi:uncharacterized protein (DUF924 family)